MTCCFVVRQREPKLAPPPTWSLSPDFAAKSIIREVTLLIWINSYFEEQLGDQTVREYDRCFGDIGPADSNAVEFFFFLALACFLSTDKPQHYKQRQIKGMTSITAMVHHSSGNAACLKSKQVVCLLQQIQIQIFTRGKVAHGRFSLNNKRSNSRRMQK